MSARRTFDLLLVALFSAGSAAPALTWALRGPDDSASIEARAAAQVPVWSWEPARIEGWPRRFDDWYRDTFGLRGTLIRWHNAVLLLGLGVSPADDVVVGEDGWLFYTGGRALDAWRGVDPLSEDELATWRETLLARRDWCRARGAEFLFLVAPNKHSIYGDKIPARYAQVTPTTRLDQLVEYLGRTSDFRIVDVRAELSAERERRGPERPIYYRLGTHWNDFGAQIAYRALLARMRESFPELEAWPPERFEERRADRLGDSWPEKMHLGDLVRQEVFDLEPTTPRRARILSFHQAPTSLNDGVLEHPDASLPRVMLFRDSFGDWLWPLLAEHSSRLEGESTVQFDAERIERLGADLVLLEMVERKLMSPVPGSAVPADELVFARTWNAAKPIESPPLELPVDARAGAPAEIPAPSARFARLELGAAVDLEVEITWSRADGTTASRRESLSAGRRWIFLGEEGGGIAEGSVRVAVSGGDGGVRVLDVDWRG